MPVFSFIASTKLFLLCLNCFWTLYICSKGKSRTAAVDRESECRAAPDMRKWVLPPRSMCAIARSDTSWPRHSVFSFRDLFRCSNSEPCVARGGHAQAVQCPRCFISLPSHSQHQQTVSLKALHNPHGINWLTISNCSPFSCFVLHSFNPAHSWQPKHWSAALWRSSLCRPKRDTRVTDGCYSTPVLFHGEKQADCW